MTQATHPAAIDIAGDPHLRDAKGRAVPIATIKPVDLLMDETVRGLIGRAKAVSAQLAAFKCGTFTSVGELQALLAQDYERWARAMEAIKDSIRVIGSKTYVRFYDRPTPDAAWRAISLDLASA